MNRRDLFIFLGLEVFAIAFAAVLFVVLESKVLAGGLAGGYFVISGLYMIFRTNRWRDKWHSLTRYVLYVHVFLISVPMLVARYMQAGREFQDVRIFGLSGPEFHNLSSGVFSVLICATVVDLFILRAKNE